MRAVWLKEFGGPEVLVAEETPDPAAAPGQALIEVEFANVTFVETQFRATGVGPFETKLPMILGNGVGGVVTSVGVGADAGLIGKRVISSTGGSGGYAELVAVDASRPYVVPDALALDAAVALLSDGRTAKLLAHAAGLHGGEKVLVEAAAGGLGTLLVQLARSAGARVVGAAGGSRKVDLARELGAEVVVDYREPDWVERVRGAVGGVDIVFDGVGGALAQSAFDLLDHGGKMISFGMSSGEWAEISDKAAADRGVSVINAPGATPEELRAFTESALTDAADGRLHPVIGQRFPLERAADAHRAMESRTTLGKTLLEVRMEPAERK